MQLCVKPKKFRNQMYTPVCIHRPPKSCCPCIAHTNCPAGKFTKAVGTATAQPQCETCTAGFFKDVKSSSSTKTERCTAHTNCPAGKYTKAVGTATAQPQCETCPAGFFKSTASKFSIVSGCERSAPSVFTDRFIGWGSWPQQDSDVWQLQRRVACARGKTMSDTTYAYKDLEKAQATCILAGASCGGVSGCGYHGCHARHGYFCL